MAGCAKWLKTFITDVPVEFVPAPDPFKEGALTRAFDQGWAPRSERRRLRWS